MIAWVKVSPMHFFILPSFLHLLLLSCSIHVCAFSHFKTFLIVAHYVTCVCICLESGDLSSFSSPLLCQSKGYSFKENVIKGKINRCIALQFLEAGTILFLQFDRPAPHYCICVCICICICSLALNDFSAVLHVITLVIGLPHIASVQIRCYHCCCGQIQ